MAASRGTVGVEDEVFVMSVASSVSKEAATKAEVRGSGVPCNLAIRVVFLPAHNAPTWLQQA